MKVKRALLLISTLVASAIVLADDIPVKLDRLHPCRADVQKLCVNVQPGSGRIVACLQENKNQLSAVCKVRLQQIAQAHEQHRDGK